MLLKCFVVNVKVCVGIKVFIKKVFISVFNIVVLIFFMFIYLFFNKNVYNFIICICFYFVKRIIKVCLFFKFNNYFNILFRKYFIKVKKKLLLIDFNLLM